METKLNTRISCPNCNQPVDPHARDCEFCGANLALAAILAERRLSQPREFGEDVPISPELLVPRLGEYLEERGVLTSEDLTKALEYQKSQEAIGQPRLIGQALLELGLVDQEVLDQVITEQILQLQTALQQANEELEERVLERTSELEQALNRLSELNQLKSEFISNVSHELKTPLTSIKGSVDNMLDGVAGELTEKQQKYVRMIVNSCNRLIPLIDNSILSSASVHTCLPHFTFTHIFGLVWSCFFHSSACIALWQFVHNRTHLSNSLFNLGVSSVCFCNILFSSPSLSDS